MQDTPSITPAAHTPAKGWLLFAVVVFGMIGALSLLRALPFAPRMATAGYDGPLVITKGGTYSGNWESSDSEVAAVEVRTAEPVIIENANIRGAGQLIRSAGYRADITVRHTNGYGITPTPWSDYKKPRRFVAVDVFKNVTVEHCYLEQTAGIYLGVEYVGNGSPDQTITIRYNKALNIDGRVYGDKDRVQFVQFNYRGEVPYAEVAWNEVINAPGASAVEDNINIYNSRGTPASPIRIHDNYIQGAFPMPLAATEYSGGGIIMDSPGTDSLTSTAYVQVYNNQLVGLGNYCLGIAGGNNIEMYDNRAVVAATFPDEKPYHFWTSGIWAKDYYKMQNTFANSMHHNTLAVVGKTGTWRNEIMDSTFLAAETYGNTILPGAVTKSMEKAEYAHWQQKLRKHQLLLGPIQ
ncbi:glycosyl hydrolase [Pontibacter sp. E15-1]|uniref:glycosyl hydrolase n=1 Tax=Pontibacter sp. E15-1 TaxID=2919918 RepID=UPI001F4FFFEA|nr:glycosyl hydrolase [Pontibacter sp. E15-1]MCJ8163497.1 glycosyl hydrolase [Pontibacter sp. E15-1]